jgi:hypothetical protein
MTHDELISTINNGITMVGQRMATHEEDALLYRKALRAVVELHQPYKNGACAGCATDYAVENIWTYPCPTIQAITEELK